MIDNLLEGNKKFRENEFSNHIDCYQNLAKGQNPKYDGLDVRIPGSTPSV